MDQYPRMDPYKGSRYEQGIDAKIVIMGNTGVGKTSLLHRYTQNKFDPKNTTSTTGAFFVTKKVLVDGLKVRLQLWDTAGQERFRSMAPMYYRGANAALLLYDITNASTFEDIRGWLEELKRNCSPDLIIYIVGSKADLHRHRQVTSDLARLSLHNWFPPPKLQPPPLPPPPPPPSSFSYIRPRFTSLTNIRSVPAPLSTTPPWSSRETTTQIESSGLKRSCTGVKRSRPETSVALTRSKSTTPASRAAPTGFTSQYAFPVGRRNEAEETSSNSINEEDEDMLDVESEEWGLRKGMELFEVSAKDDFGVDGLFESLISAIISRKDVIDQENEIKKRDSVLLSSVTVPPWSTQSEAEEDSVKMERPASIWSCCAT